MFGAKGWYLDMPAFFSIRQLVKLGYIYHLMQTFDTSTTPSSGNNSYVLVINGKPEGPFTIEKLKELNLKQGDFVKTPAMDDYKEAHEVAELRVLFGFKAQSVIPQYFGSFDQRLMAAAIDQLLVGGIFIIIAFIAILFITDSELRPVVGLSIVAMAPVANFIYHVLMECSAKQATLGKQAIKIKVCDTDGQRISFGRSAWRNFAKVFSAATFFIGYLLAFFTRQKQALHDILAGTLVMKDRLF
jgi:uncharacterized RDD family membrane protein YckC